MNRLAIALIMFIPLLFYIFIRIPISFSLALSVLPILLIMPRVTPLLLFSEMIKSYGSFILLCVPFFILAANIMNKSGITDRLIKLANSLVGSLPGGLAHVNILVSMLFAGISGSSNADAAGIGSVLIPAMVKNGYDKSFSVAVTACSAVMGVIIPPSILMVVWGGVMNVSVSGLFGAGVIPGIMIAFFQMILVYVLAIKRKYPFYKGFNLKNVIISFKNSIFALVTPIIIVGGIVGGIVTPTEASLIAVLYSIFLSIFIYHTIKVNELIPILLETAKTSSIILFSVGMASIYSWVLSYYSIPQLFVSVLTTYITSPIIMLFMISLIFLFVGTFMDAVPAIIILGPLLLPLAESVGIHVLHFAIVGVVSIAFGLVTPPYGLCLLICSEIAGINCMKAIKDIALFFIVMLFVILLIILFPNLSLFIPKMFMPELF